jgi:tetratricopeptide (TPR) repeat protein
VPWLLVVFIGLAIGLGARLYVGRGRAASLEQTAALVARGGLGDLRAAADDLSNMSSRTPCSAAAEAVVRAQIVAEYGEPADTAAPALARAAPERERCRDVALAEALLALAAGDLDGAQAAADLPVTVSARPARAWLLGALALAGRLDPATAKSEIDATLAETPAAIAPRRATIWLSFQAGDPSTALHELSRARAAGRDHLGLAADEALLHAALRRDLSGVADLADQLLALDPAALGPRDLARAGLARAAVHVHAGQPAAGLARIDAAFPALAPWDAAARRLALELSLEAGDAARARDLLTALAVAEPEASIVRAWALLAEGDVMASLEALAACPQDHPRVAYLQGLALVEQRRFAEAEPWLARADRLLPGRVEVEVARARVEVQQGAVATAARKLEGIADTEVYAPRAYTGLGEAYLAQGDDPRTLRLAQRALTRAVEREPRPAEAMLLLGEVWQRRRLKAPEAERNALAWYEQAAEAGPHLPRYREALARFLADTGRTARAEQMLRDLSQQPGVTPATPLLLLELALARTDDHGEPPPADAESWLAAAEASGADADALTRARARLYLSQGTRTSLARARADLEALLRRRPADVDARVLAARVLAAAHELEPAETLVRQGFYASEPGRPPATGRLFFAWGEVALRQRKRKQAALHARAGFHRMLTEQRPTVELVAAVDFATAIFLRTDQHKLALGMTRELTEALPFHGPAWRLHARALFSAGETGKAARALARALEHDPDDPRALELRGQLAARTGDREAARKALARALELSTREPDRQRVRDLLRRLAG